MKPALKFFLFPLLPAAMLLVVIVILLLKQSSPEKTVEIIPKPTQPETIDIPVKNPSTESPAKSASEPVQVSVEDDRETLQLGKASETVAGITDLLDDGEELTALHEMRTLRDHPNRNVRLSVIEAIRWIGLPAAMDAAAMMDDSDKEIRTMAQDTFWAILRELEDPKLKKDLLETALSSNDPELRMEVLDELLYLPDELSSNLLMQATNDPNEDVAEQARDNLSFISGE